MQVLIEMSSLILIITIFSSENIYTYNYKKNIECFRFKKYVQVIVDRLFPKKICEYSNPDNFH